MVLAKTKVGKNESLLMEMLDKRNQLTTEEVADLLKISLSTVRRLFIKLEEKGDALRTFGGICKNTVSHGDYSYNELATRQVEDKYAIAKAAVSLVEENDIIYLDGGTTVAVLAHEIAEKISAKELNSIIIFTNSLVNLDCLAEICTVNLIGGKFRPNRKDFCGYIAEEAIKCLHFTKCFLGADAYEASKGFTTTDFDTARLNSLVASMSDFSCLVIDSTKFGRSSFVRFADLSDISMIITDSKLDEGHSEHIMSTECALKIACNL